MDLEEGFGVRSAFLLLNQWARGFAPKYWYPAPLAVESTRRT
jgi:hypothetical protein